MSSRVEEWLSEFVNSPRFAHSIEAEIDLLDKPLDRIKVRLELLSYVAPKVKNVDALTPDQLLKAIEITYTAAKPPKKKPAKAAP